jgi:hypothetical protein
MYVLLSFVRAGGSNELRIASRLRPAFAHMGGRPPLHYGMQWRCINSLTCCMLAPVSEHSEESCTNPSHCPERVCIQVDLPHHRVQTLERWMDRRGITDRAAAIEALLHVLAYRPHHLAGKSADWRTFQIRLHARVEYHARRIQRRKA